jgi:hypothetical protein
MSFRPSQLQICCGRSPVLYELLSNLLGRVCVVRRGSKGMLLLLLLFSLKNGIVFRRRLTLGTTCILAAGCYVVDDGAQPWEERGAGGYSVFVKVVICIVRTLRRDSRCGNEVLECVGDAGTSLVWSKSSAARISPAKDRVDRTAGTRSRSRSRAAGESTTQSIAGGGRGDRRVVAMFSVAEEGRRVGQRAADGCWLQLTARQWRTCRRPRWPGDWLRGRAWEQLGVDSEIATHASGLISKGDYATERL